MSQIHIIACDYPLPLIEKEDMFVRNGFSPNTGYWDGIGVADEYIKKEYKYDISLGNKESSVILLRDYLDKHMRNGGEVEIWSLWLGYGQKNYKLNQPQLKNISAYENAEAVDEYVDSLPAEVNRKSISIDELSIDEILFINRNVYVYIVVKK
jgi:hypothetical protein